MILVAETRTRAEGRRLVIVPGPPPVQRVVCLTGLDTWLTFASDPDAAL